MDWNRVESTWKHADSSLLNLLHAGFFPTLPVSRAKTVWQISLLFGKNWSVFAKSQIPFPVPRATGLHAVSHPVRSAPGPSPQRQLKRMICYCKCII